MEERNLSKKSDKLLHEGVSMVEYGISLPNMNFGGKGETRIKEILSSVFKEAENSVNTLYKKAKEEYTSDTNARKRFCFKPYKYSLSYEVTDCNGEIFSFVLTLTLSRQGRILLTEKSGIAVTKSSGLIMPLRVAVGRGYSSGKRALKKGFPKTKFDYSNFYIRGGVVFLLTRAGNAWKSYEFPQKKAKNQQICKVNFAHLPISH